MDVFKTPGAFSWSELMTTDPAAAAKFYGALFGWTIDAMEMGGGGLYHVVKVGDAGVGGIMGQPPGAPAMPPMWGCYVTVVSVEETVAKCTALGGRLVMPPVDIPKVGRMAVIQDPQGATLSVIAYAME